MIIYPSLEIAGTIGGEKEDNEEGVMYVIAATSGIENSPDISKDTLEFMLSLPVERKIFKVSELETVYATPEQQEEMEKTIEEK